MMEKLSNYDDAKCVSFFIKDNELLEKYNKIWNNVRKINSKPVYNGKYLITKIKSYKGKTNANFHDDGVPKEGFPCICLSVMLIDSILKKNKNYYLQLFLEEC